MNAPPFDRRDNDRERAADPQHGINHAAALGRILERRIRRLEEAVFGRQSDRSAAPTVVHRELNHAAQRHSR